MEYIAENLIAIGNMTFELDTSNQIRSKVSTPDRFVLMKTPDLVDTLVARLKPINPKVIVEFGIQRGGSVAFFSELFRPDLHICFELDTTPIPALQTFQKKIQKEGRSLELHYGVNQGDHDKVLSLVNKGLQARGLSEIDLILDDASHLYAPSKVSFEALFPLLRRAGMYVLEDWGWAHWPGYQKKDSPYLDEPALSNLVFEMTMLCACRRDVMPQLIINSGLVFAQRGGGQLNRSAFNLEQEIVCRGKSLGQI